MLLFARCCFLPTNVGTKNGQLSWGRINNRNPILPCDFLDGVRHSVHIRHNLGPRHTLRTVGCCCFRCALKLLQQGLSNCTNNTYRQSFGHKSSFLRGMRCHCHSRWSVSFKNLSSAFAALSCNVFCQRHPRMASTNMGLSSRPARANARDCL